MISFEKYVDDFMNANISSLRKKLKLSIITSTENMQYRFLATHVTFNAKHYVYIFERSEYQ